MSKSSRRGLTRRELLARGGALAAGVAALSALPTVAAPVARPAARPSGLKRFDGVTINAVFVSGEHDETLLRERIGEVKEQLGIDLTVTDLAAGAMHDKIAQGFRAGQSPYEVTTIVGFWLAEMVGAGLLEPLEPFLNNPELTPEDYDFNDFVDKHLDYIAYWNLEEKRNGRPGTLFLIPGPHSDAHMVTYRKDLFEKYGVAGPAKTWDEYVEVARKLHHPEDGVYGTAFVGKLDPSAALTDWANRMVSVGAPMFKGSIKDRTVVANFDSPESVAALENIRRLVDYSPPGVTSYGITEVSDAMAAGQIGMMMMWAVVSGKLWEPSLSKVADKVEAALVPGKDTFAGTTIRGGWGMGIPRDVQNKEAAWAVIRYYSSKEVDKARVMNYGLAPVRTSTLQDPEVVAKYPYMPVLAELLQKATPFESIPFPESWEFVLSAAEQVNLVATKQKSPEQAARDGQEKWTEILKRGGWNANA